MSPISDRTRRLVLLRHAKAEPGDGTADEVRPLALDGRRQAGRVGAALHTTDLVPELVLVSPAVRTRQTWELLRGAFGDAEPEVVLTDGLYTAGVDDVLALLREVDERVRTVLVVGHEPTMSAAAAALAGPSSDTAAVARVRAGVPTATYAVLELDGPWDGLAPGTLDLRAVIAPHE
ncbi:histidine phosphatase family protein [Cellulomonas sp. ATA003]|uniref:SixA phosphatase family protein n=1 Tax=Cellulomonas sp. ATA003 TaxID=3073064 RepID=UPI00287347F6|nr:histidine phosphatase family protein [Cellulomonas sp. ATA003]WNB86817.1 histidine phosphatase family protein [Cellulomonas sp. ATA003]